MHKSAFTCSGSLLYSAECTCFNNHPLPRDTSQDSCLSLESVIKSTSSNSYLILYYLACKVNFQISHAIADLCKKDSSMYCCSVGNAEAPSQQSLVASSPPTAVTKPARDPVSRQQAVAMSQERRNAGRKAKPQRDGIDPMDPVSYPLLLNIYWYSRLKQPQLYSKVLS